MTSSTPSSPPGSEDRPAGQPEAGDDDAATIADLRARIDDLDQQRRRALADGQNLRRRFARDTASIREEERAAAARLWLTVVDNLDRALEHAEADPASIVDGVQAVRDQAVQMLGELGFPRRDDTGEPFDPARHEAIGSLPGTDAPAGTVVHVVQPGYGSGEHQLRPAQVVVAGEP
jgi:molecular chaperone GrpE